MHKILSFILLTIISGEDNSSIKDRNYDLRSIVEDASRSSQKVFVEDFTGLQ